MAVKTTQGWTAARTLHTLQRYRGFTDRQLGDAAGGYSASAILQRRRGITTIDTDDIERLATALGVEPWVMLLSAGDALKWVLDNRPNPPAEGMLASGESSFACTRWPRLELAAA